MRFSFLLLMVTSCSSPARLQDSIVVTPRTETFTQTAVGGGLDLLFVIDNSQSMIPNQQQIANNTQTLFDWLNRSAVDYHVAVTSTDLLGVSGRGIAAKGHFSTLGGTAIIRVDSPDAAGVFAKNVQLGNDGSNHETPIACAMTALGLIKAQNGAVPSGNEGFLRANARLAIVFLTDEDDQSEMSYSELSLALRNLKGRGNNSQIYLAAVVWDDLAGLDKTYKFTHPERIPPGTCKTAPSDQSAGFTFFGLIGDAPFPGYLASICGDFSQTLRQLGLDASGVVSDFTLSGRPDSTVRVVCPDANNLATVCVQVNGTVVGDATYDPATNRVHFLDTDVPPLGSTITVSYGIETKGREPGAPDQSICGSDTDCPRGVACQSGICHLGCTTDSVCSAGFICTNKVCACSSDASCAASESCSTSGVCQPRSGCRVNSDCASGQVCNASVCIAATSCVNADTTLTNYPLLDALSCDKSYVCVNGTCASGCEGDEDCPGGQSCIYGPDGVSTMCAAGCNRDSQCCIHQYCDTNTSQCKDAKSVSATIPYCDASSCTSNACSAAGGICEELYTSAQGCTPPCTADSDCGAGSFCDSIRSEDTLVCTFGGHECTGGRTCGASAESPTSSCNCLSNADCASEAACISFSDGKQYCALKQKYCGASYPCNELTPNFDTACWDNY